MSNSDKNALAQELLSAYTTGGMISPTPSARHEDFDLNAAYAVEAELCRLRKESGRETVGLKVGYANRAIWRVLKLETLVWAHMFDDTVHYASENRAELALPYERSAKIEPEIIFRLREPVPFAGLDAETVLQRVDWLAIGFEIIDCPYPDWQFKPADFVAAFGLHLGLVVAQPLIVESERIPALAEGLASFKVRVSKDGNFIEQGAGKNALRSPAMSLAELAGALVRQSGASPLSAGQLISTGTLTSGHPVARGETWQVEVEGLPLSNLTLHIT